MLAETTTNDWSVLGSPALIAGNAVFAMLYLGGFALLRRKNMFTFWRYLGMETFSCLPVLGALLWNQMGHPAALAFVILAWPMLPIVLMLPYLVWPSTDKGTSDHELRWDLRTKRR